MNSNWLRRPVGLVQGSLGVLCLSLLPAAVGCGAENQSSIDGAGAAGERAIDGVMDGVNDGVNELANAKTAPWGPDEDCRPWGCAENVSSQSAIAPPTNAQTCTTSAECGSGFCKDGVCCDSACTGTCQACTAAKKGSGVDGTCGVIALYGDPDNECASGACDGTGKCQQYNGVACAGGTDCLSANCVDGYCCGNACSGTCVACSAAKRGGGVNGQCGAIATSTDPDNECATSDCNGSGACQAPQGGVGNGSACTGSAQCTSGNCADGVCCDSACTGACQACTAAKKFQGTDGTCGPIAATKNPDGECSGGYCNGSSACVYYNGVACTGAAQCLSANCVDGYCCGNACAGPCMACSAAKRGGGVNGQCGPIAVATDPDNECTNAECNGSGTCNLGQGLAIGNACTQSAQCTSGNCADGVCCDSACTGLCQACTATKKGQGETGTCGPIAVDKDPDNECTSGNCGGAGTCKFYNGAACGAGADCSSGYCVDNVCCGNACTDTCRSCSAAKKGGGVNGQCGMIISGTDPDNECGGAGSCNGAAACMMVETGFACDSSAECSTGFCVDGVCCASACTGTCFTCNATGLAGTCSPVPQGQSDANSTPICAGTCDGLGTCQSNSGTVCSSGSQCLSHVCDDELCANVAAPIVPFQWATILSPTSSSTIAIDWLTPLANGGISGSGTKTGTIDLNGWLLDADPSRTQPWSFSFDVSGSPTDVSDSAVNDADNETTYLRARARYSDIVATQHWFHGGGNSEYTAQIDAPAWSRSYDDTEITSLSTGDGGHVLIAATVSPDSLNGVDFGDGLLVTGDRLVKYDPTGQIEFNTAVGLSLGTIIGPTGAFYNVSRQAGLLSIVKQDGLGNPLWTKAIPMTAGPSATPSVGQVFDESGNMLLTFNFSGSVDFGNGAITAVGTNDLGLVKLDANGNALWAKRFGTSTLNVTSVYMDFTSTDDVAVVAFFQGTANLGNGDFTGSRFLAKFDETGTLVWRGTPPASWYALTGSPSGAIFIGATSLATDFGWGTPLAGTGGLVIAKYGN